MNSQTPRARLRGWLSALLTLSALAVAPIVIAAPTGGAVHIGAAAIDSAGPVTTITQNSDLLIVNWESFDLAASERMEIIQPQRDSVILLNVVGAAPTAILGALSANGRVVLTNSAGIDFGASAQLAAADLWAAGIQVDSEALIAGSLSAVDDAAGGPVRNAGQLRAQSGGSVTLWGERVANSGTVTAELGSIALVAARSAVVGIDAIGHLAVSVTTGPTPDDDLPAISNTGMLHAQVGRVTLLAAPGSNDLDALGAEVPSAEGAADIANSGTIDVSAAGPDSEPGPYRFRGQGEILLLGRDVSHSGLIAGDIYGLGTAVVPPPADWPEDEEYSLDRWSTIEEALPERSAVVLAAAGQLRLSDAAVVRANGSAEIPTLNEHRHHGGHVRLLGANIELADQARVETIGLGLIPALPNGKIEIGAPGTRTVSVGEAARINANGALEQESREEAGNPGAIELFADDLIRVSGALTARPGYDGSPRRGGNISVYSGGELDVDGPVDASSTVSEFDYWNAGEHGLLSFTAGELILTDAEGEGLDTAIFDFGLQNYRLHGLRSMRADPATAPTIATDSQITIRAGTSTGEPGEIDLRDLTIEIGSRFNDLQRAPFSIDMEAGGNIVPPRPAQIYDSWGWRGNIRMVSRQGDIHFYPARYHSMNALDVRAGGNIVFEPGATLEQFPSGTQSTGTFSAGEAIDVTVVTHERAGSSRGQLSLSAASVVLRVPEGVTDTLITADAAGLSGNGDVAVALAVTGATQIDSAPGGRWQLSGSTKELGMNLPEGAFLRLDNSADLHLNHVTMVDAAAELSAPGRLLCQNFDRKIRSTRSQLHLDAQRLVFGANATSRIEMSGGGNLLSGNFARILEFNGLIRSDSASDLYRFHGSDASNRLDIKDTAVLRSVDNFFGDVRLGGGDDAVRIAAPGSYRLYLGEGADNVEAYSSLINIWAVDFDPAEDRLVFRPR